MTVFVTGLLMILMGVAGLVVVKLLGVVVQLEAMRLVVTDLPIMGMELTPPPCGI